MAQRIFVTCRSNHDPIFIANYACEALLGRGYDYTKDYVRWAGTFGNERSCTKCQVLVDCNLAEHESAGTPPLRGYTATSTGSQITISPANFPPMLQAYLERHYAWGRPSPKEPKNEPHDDATITLISTAHFAAVVAWAVDYEGKWPKTSGIRGDRMTYAEIITIREKIRGIFLLITWYRRKLYPYDSTSSRPFTVEEVKWEDLEIGILNTLWALEKRHRAVSDEQNTSWAKIVSVGILLSSTKGAWDVSDELNQLFPEHEFDTTEAFLRKVWGGKP